MNVSFQKPGGPASLADATLVAEVPANAIPVGSAPNTALATIPQVTPPAPSQTGFRDDEDSIDPRDLQLPRLNVVQKVGDLSNVFNGGAVVLDGSLVLVDGPDKSDIKNLSKPFNFVLVGFQPTKFVEKVEFGQQGLTVASEREVANANGTLDFKEAKATGKKWFQPATQALILIEQPEGDKSVGFFTMPLDGKKYALALFYLKGTGYTNVAKPIKTQKKIGQLIGKQYRNAVFTAQTKLEKYTSNFAYIAVVKLTAMSSEKFLADLNSLGL